MCPQGNMQPRRGSSGGLYRGREGQIIQRTGNQNFRGEVQKLVQNIDSMVNIGEAITHQVKCNMFFKGHVERIKINVYNLGKTEVILGILQLAAHNPEIDWEKREVKITRCLPICGRKKKKEKKMVRKIEEEKTVEELVPRRFWKWKKVFGKAKSERIPVQKTWNYAIELKEGFVPKKEKVCSLSREE